MPTVQANSGCPPGVHFRARQQLQVLLQLTAVAPTMNLPRNWLVIKDECEDASVVQLGYRHTSLLKQLDGWKNGGDGKVAARFC